MACLWAVYRISTHKIEYSFLDFFQLLSPLLGVVVFRKWWKAILNSHPKGENRILSPQRCWDRSRAESRTPWWWCWSVRVLRTGTPEIFSSSSFGEISVKTARGKHTSLLVYFRDEVFFFFSYRENVSRWFQSSLVAGWRFLSDAETRS